jgi:hypothetical protein
MILGKRKGISASGLSKVEKELKRILDFAIRNEQGCTRNGMSQSMYWEGKRVAILEVMTLLNIK